MSSGVQGEGRGSSLPVVMTEHGLTARERRQDRWWAAALWSWLAAIGWCWVVVATAARTLARVGDVWVVWWHPALALALAGVLCLGVALGLSARTAALRRAELRVLPRRRRTAKVVGTIVVGLGLATTLAVVVVLEGETALTVLEPASTSGCVVVVEETRGFMTGSGRIGTLAPDGIVPRWQGSYGSDDAYRPFTDGASVLRWTGEEGTLALLYPSQPTAPSEWAVAC